MQHRSAALAEAERLMTICNACRYCEGLCAVFPAMELRRTFADGDLDYLANLCHSCSACYHDCQFSPPHEFAVNVPKVLAEVRSESYARYAWPAALQPVFRRNGLWIALVTALLVTLFLLGLFLANGTDEVFAAHRSPESFYALVPHGVMVALFGPAFLYALFAMFMGARAFWRDTGDRDVDESAAPSARPAAAGTVATPASGADFGRAARDAATLRYLDGGGEGCMNADESPNDTRRRWHHLTFYGFLLCLASTSIATLYHYLLGRVAPYPWWDLPVVLGTLGGIGLVAGPIGLMRAKRRRAPAVRGDDRFGMDIAFLAMLFATGLTGLLLLFLRATPALGVLLAVHLGVVMALFLSMPYGKFVHGLYRYLALARHARERRAARLSAPRG